MAAALEITPESGSITAKVSACRINVTGADPNQADGTENRYRIIASFDDGGVDDLVSHEFNVNGGKHEWNNLIFPEAGDWTLDLVDLSDDSVVATEAVEVD